MAETPTSYEANVFSPVSSGNALSATPAASDGSVIGEIEAAADYHVPAVYQLLGFYSSYRVETDSNSSFIPVTQTKPNPKLFVVGILPPSVPVSGRLLDRSASVSAPPVSLDQPEGGDVAIGEEDGVVIPSGGSTKGADLPASFWHEYVRMSDRLKVDPYELAAVLDKESRFNPGAQNKGPDSERTTPIAQGLCQFVRDTAISDRVKMDEDQWKTFCLLSAEEQLPYVENFYKGRVAGKGKNQINYITFGANNNPDGSAYASKEQQAAWIAAHPGDAGKFKKPDKQDRAVKSNPEASTDGGKTIQKAYLDEKVANFPRPEIRARIQSAQQYVAKFNSAKGKDLSKESTNGRWKEEGSSNASVSKRERAKTAQIQDEAKADLGKKFQYAQQAEINETIRAIEALRYTPPLRLLVNPSSFSVKSERVTSDGNWTRNGPIVEHWGENQDKIEASGKVSAFFAIDANSPKPDAQGEGPGLTRGARQYSAGYQNFMSLYLLYRSNANVYTSDLLNSTSEYTFMNRLSMVGSMYIFYDDTLYIGSFDSFNITENDTAPYTLEYSFEFTVRGTFLLDRPPPYTAEAQAALQSSTILPTTTTQVSVQEDSDVAPPPEEQLLESLIEEELRKELGL
jgi:hypothetical protein